MVGNGGIFTKVGRRNCPCALVFCALNLEANAVTGHLTDVGEALHEDGNVYEYGYVESVSGTWFVAVAVIGKGNVEGALQVSRAIRNFDKIDLAAFVGIAGGLKEVEIGDVVAASMSYCYELGKETEDFIPTPSYAIPYDESVGRIANLLIRNNDWQKRIISTGSSISILSDLLPKALHAPIAAGEKVLKNREGPSIEVIKMHYPDAVAVEMEGYGFLRACFVEHQRSILVRGISDLIKNKTPELDQQNQPMAAAHAAAFFVHLLEKMLSIGLVQYLPLPIPESEIFTPTSSNSPERILVQLTLEGDISSFGDDEKARLVASLERQLNTKGVHIESVSQGSIKCRINIEKTAADQLFDEFEVHDRRELGGYRVLDLIRLKDLESRDHIRQEFRRASLPVAKWPSTVGQGKWLPRDELGGLLAAIRSGNARCKVILGKPGSGKSSLLSKLYHELIAEGVTVLAIKSDILPESVCNERALGEFLGLSCAPADALRRAASIGQTVLLIDQLDAISALADLKTQRLNTILNLIYELTELQGLSIVVSARDFEYRHDVRLSTIDADCVQLNPVAWRHVSDVLKENDIASDVLTPSGQDVLQNPQFLKIFLRVVKNSPGIKPEWGYVAMLQLWLTQTLERLGNDRQKLESLLSAIATEMSDRETLWLPEAKWIASADGITDLVSEGILVKSQDESLISFSHQSLFELVIARSIVRGDLQLSKYVLDRQDGLFVRPKLWTALQYLRNVDVARYEQELVRLWDNEMTRLHIRLLLVETMCEYADPLAAELKIADAILHNDLTLSLQLLNKCNSSPLWFAFLGKYHLPRLMTSSDERLTRGTVRFLSSGLNHDRDEVMSLVEECWLSQERGVYESFLFFLQMEKWDERASRDVCALIEKGTLSHSMAEMLINSVGQSEPKLAPMVLAALISGQSRAAASKISQIPDDVPEPPDEMSEYIKWRETYAVDKPYKEILERSFHQVDVIDLARRAPCEFVVELWPVMLRILNALAQNESDRPNRYPAECPGWSFSEDDPDADSHVVYPLPNAMAVAIADAARQSMEWFMNWFAENHGLEIGFAQRLVLKGYTALVSAGSAVEPAIEYLCGDVRRLSLGDYDERYIDSKKLLAQLFRWADDNQVMRLSQLVLSWKAYPEVDSESDAEGRMKMLKWNRMAQLEMLKLIPFERAPVKLRRHIEAEERAFPAMDESKTASGEGYIGSPMTHDQLEKASIDELETIFDDVHDEWGWTHPKDLWRGGSIQLSRELSIMARTQVNKVIDLSKRFVPDRQERAMLGALDGLAESNLPSGQFYDLIIDADRRGFSNIAFRSEVSRILEKRIKKDEGLSEAVIGVMEQWLFGDDKTGNESAANDLQVSTDDVELSDETKEETERAAKIESVLWGRGKIAALPAIRYPILEALLLAFLYEKPRNGIKIVRMLERYLEKCTVASHWISISRLFKYIPNKGSKEHVEFVTSLLHAVPAFRESHEGAICIAQSQINVESLVFRDWIGLYEKGSWTLAPQTVGELVALRAITRPDDREAAEEAWQICKTLPGNERSNAGLLGVTHTASFLWKELKYREKCTEMLVSIITLRTNAVSAAFMRNIANGDAIRYDQYFVDLLQEIALAPDSFWPTDDGVDAIGDFIEELQIVAPRKPELVHKILMSFLTCNMEKINNFRTSMPLVGPTIVNLALTIHRLGGDNRARGLQLFEQALALSVYGAEEALVEIDDRPVKIEKQKPLVRHRRRKLTRKRRVA